MSYTFNCITFPNQLMNHYMQKWHIKDISYTPIKSVPYELSITQSHSPCAFFLNT